MNIFYIKPYLIADIGVNYYDIAQKEEISTMEAAKLMILEAKKAGIDAVKFESYKTENISCNRISSIRMQIADVTLDIPESVNPAFLSQVLQAVRYHL